MYTLLAYVDSTGKYKLISQAQADSAFDAAMVSSKVASQTVFDLSDTSLRNTFWSLLETATANLENSLANPNFKNFMASTQLDLNVTPVPSPTASAAPTPSPSPVVYNTYPTGFGSYVAGSKVKGKDGNLYECKPSPYTPWCNGAAWAYEPGVGSVWDQAWIKL
jgi:glutamine cyclotransferase